MSGWEFADWVEFAAAFVGTLAVFALIALEVREARDERRDDRLGWAAAGLSFAYWTQVGALEFRRYLENEDGRVELERVIYEDTPAGRLAARDFREGHNVTGPTVLHTRETGRR